MKIYTVMRMDQYGNDFEIALRKLGVFLDQNSAIACARAEYRNLLSECSKTMERIEALYYSRITEIANLTNTEKPEIGIFDIHFEFMDNREYYLISVDEWIF